MGDDRGAAPEHRVAGQQAAVIGQQERQRVGRMPGRPHDQDLEARHPYPVPVGQAFAAEAQTGVERPHPSARDLREPGGALGVVRMTVGQQHQLDGEVIQHQARRNLRKPLACRTAVVNQQTG